MATYRIYNLPWSGRCGRISKRCIYCGTGGSRFQISSFGDCCVDCRGRTDPQLKLVEQLEADYDRLSRKWADKHGIDYDATVENFRKHLGEMEQELSERPPHRDGDDSQYIVYKTPAACS